MASQARTTCLGCSGTLIPVFSLGRMPLANAYPAMGDIADAPRYPLDLEFCPECCLVQLGHIVPPAEMFSEYLYLSSYSNSMLRHAEALADTLVASRRLTSTSLVVEIASNDGYLLQYFQRAGIPVLGIEPAANVAAVAERQGVPTLNAFFDASVASTLASAGDLADVILGLNVMAHVPDPNAFLAQVRTVLKPEGVAVIEVPYVRDMVERCEFDTIYHEHVFYFSVHALVALAERHGLVLQDVQQVPIHGGSIRVFLAAGDRHGPSVERMLQDERTIGLTRSGYFETFGRKAEELRDRLTETVDALLVKGARIGSYGAAAKATILSNYCGFSEDQIGFVSDRNEFKQGRRLPGSNIPIVPVDAIAERRPDYVLLFVWNLRDEILKQEADYRRRGGRFIVPIPHVEVV